MTDGGIETDLIFNQGLNLPSFSSLHLFHQGKYQELYNYFAEYARISLKYKMPMILQSASWRASLDWGPKLGLTL